MLGTVEHEGKRIKRVGISFPSRLSINGWMFFPLSSHGLRDCFGEDATVPRR